MTQTTFSHQKANSPEARYTDGGLRSFFVYRDTGVTAATNGQVRVQLVRAAHRALRPRAAPVFISTPPTSTSLNGPRLGQVRL